MAREASTSSASNRAQARSSVSSSSNRKRVSLTRIRRDASVELDDETSASEYSQEESGSASEEELVGERSPKRARGSSTVSSQQSSVAATASSTPKYTSLRPETRKISAEVIKNKWKPTTAAAQTKVRTVMSLVERPVINSHREPERRKEAQSSLTALTRIIEARLPRMPFPPDTKEWHFDYEAILRNNRDLEQQLGAAKHSSMLAQSEIAKEKKLLEEAEAELAELKRNAKAEQRARAQRERGTPSLWTETTAKKPDDADRIGFKTSSSSATQGLSINDQDFPFVEELEDHLDQIENNISQLNGISQSLDRATSVLDTLRRGEAG